MHVAGLERRPAPKRPKYGRPRTALATRDQAAREWTKKQLERYLEGLRAKPRLDPLMGVLERVLEREIARRPR